MSPNPTSPQFRATFTYVQFYYLAHDYDGRELRLAAVELVPSQTLSAISNLGRAVGPSFRPVLSPALSLGRLADRSPGGV